MKITEACIEKPVFAWMLMAATLVFGGVAASRIGISQYPDVDFPTISIDLRWEGAAPEAMEHDVVELVEEAVIQVEGVRAITSSSRQGAASITLEFDISRDIDLAMQEVQAKVSQAQFRLPRDIDPPIVSKTNPEDNPIMWVGVSGAYPQQFISDFARYRVKEALQTIEGVGEIMLGGYLDRNIRIWVDADRLNEKNVTVTEVISALQRQHLELPAGRLETQGREVNVRVLGEALDIETFRKLVIREVDGAPIYLADVAIVEDGFEDVRRMARVNGVPAQGLGVKKQRGANAVAVAERVHAKLAELRQSAPEGLEIGINFDSTRFIEESVHELQFELVLSVILTALVCWLFLGSLSSTLNVVLAIPMSLLGTVGVIYFAGFTLNTFTLLGLALAVGIVVDDAIMVMENIFRHREEGKDAVRAAREGTFEITFAALAATIAIIAIFAPVVFMKGIVGRYFLQFGVTLSIAVLLSYLEAITLAPARCAQLLHTGHERKGLGRLVDVGFDKLASGYGFVLERTLRHPGKVLIAASAIIGLAWFAFKALPSEFVPSQDQSRLMVRVQTAVGSSLEETDKLFQKAEAVVSAKPEVKRAFAVVGGFGGAGVNTGIFFLTLQDPKERKLTQAEFQQVLRRDLNAIPGIRAIVQDLSQAGFTANRGFPVEFSVRGPDWETLIAETEKLKDELTASGLVVDVDTDYRVGMPELQVKPNRARAADLGVSVEAIATTINALVGGVRAGKYSTGGRRIDVRLRLLRAQREGPQDLAALRVRSASGELVPLSYLVEEDERPALQAITRKDRERAISVYGNIAPGHSQDEALAKVEALAKELPTGYRAVLGGASVAFRDSSQDLVFALILGILVAYMVLASQFNSFLHPVTVLTILVPSVAGAMFALYLAGKSLNIFSMIGLLLLLGIVKKNSIILVDYATQLVREGLDPRSAMLRAGPVRLRPILMTSLATMMAAIPPSLGLGPGSETRGPMAIAVIGGLVFSTALSLVIVPAFYVVASRLTRRRTPAPVGPAVPATAD
ncbi:efflux RND transporter permease subunit [Myxococcota bacterium]|nr:efflux RND transporter permease subunit [Myxococcota bacterium]